jgi:hypothetical protein
MRVRFPWAAGCLGLAALVLPGAPAIAADAPTPSAEAQPAVWTPKELNFVYMGFTSHYSCDGLRDRMRQALLILGARADLAIGPYGCTAPDGRPDPFPGVHVRMNVLTPAPAGGSGAAGGQSAATLPAQWKKVELRLGTDALDQSGNCELLEQIRQKVLPLFTTRNVDFSSNCVPKQLSAGGNWLRAEVLSADQKGDKTLASK